MNPKSDADGQATSVGATNRKARNLLIYPKFQLTLIIVNTVTLLITLAFIGVQNWRTLKYMKDLGVSVDLPVNHTYFQFIDMQAKHLWMNLGLAFVLATLISSLASTCLIG